MEQQAKNEKRQKEIRTHAHVMALIIYSVFTAFLIMVSLLLSWELWTVYIMVIGLLSVWGLHIAEIGTERFRSYIYVICMLLETFFYSIHDTSFFDMALVMCIVMFLLSVLNEMPMLYMGLGTYAMIYLYHAFVTGELLHLSGVLECSRLGLHITCIATGFVLARYMIGRRREEKENYTELIEYLKELNQRTEDFLANVSHELRTPINAVTGISDVMLQGDLDSQTKRNVLNIQQAGRRLFIQINDILDYSEIVSEHLKVEDAPYEIASMINDIISSTTLINRKKKLEIVFDINPQIPSMLCGDEQKLNRIIQSILDNSIKFTNQGGIMVRVYTREEAYGVNLYISVEDTGIGMTDTQAKRVYDGFYQADTGRTRRVGGMGLGLSIVHGIVRGMGGFMNVESKPDEGTKVSLCIPQKVQNQKPFVSVEKPEEKRVLCYLQKDKFEIARIREFYDEMIDTMGEHLKVSIVRAFNQREVENYVEKYKITHVFVSNIEYDECPSYYDKLCQTTLVTVITDMDWNKKVPREFMLIRKPVSVIPIANVISQEGVEAGAPIQMKNSIVATNVNALVVDDDSMNINVASGILKSYGMNLDVAYGGLEALGKCKEKEYDLIFMDYMMPDLDGIETVKRLRNLPQKYNKSVPVIALTANAMSGAKEMFMAAGFHDFVPKPIQRNVLERAIRHSLPKSKWNSVESEEQHLLQEDSEEQPVYSPLSYLENAGIHTADGIAYCAGNEEFYIEMLDEFQGNASRKMEELERAFQEEDWKAYTIAIHTVKGNSKTIGADGLSEIALELQQAGEEGNIDFIRKTHDNMMNQLGQTVQNVATALEMQTGEEGEHEKENP